MNIKTYILYIDEIEKQIFKNTVVKNNIDDKDYIYFKGVDGNLFNESYLEYIDNFNKSIFNIDDKDLDNIIDTFLSANIPHH